MSTIPWDNSVKEGEYPRGMLPSNPTGQFGEHKGVDMKKAPHFGPRGEARSKAISKGLNRIITKCLTTVNREFC